MRSTTEIEFKPCVNCGGLGRIYEYEEFSDPSGYEYLIVPSKKCPICDGLGIVVTKEPKDEK